MEGGFKLATVISLIILLLVASLGNLITTETQTVSTVVSIVVYWVCLFIDD